MARKLALIRTRLFQPRRKPVRHRMELGPHRVVLLHVGSKRGRDITFKATRPRHHLMRRWWLSDSKPSWSGCGLDASRFATWGLYRPLSNSPWIGRADVLPHLSSMPLRSRPGAIEDCPSVSGEHDVHKKSDVTRRDVSGAVVSGLRSGWLPLQFVWLSSWWPISRARAENGCFGWNPFRDSGDGSGKSGTADDEAPRTTEDASSSSQQNVMLGR